MRRTAAALARAARLAPQGPRPRPPSAAAGSPAALGGRAAVPAAGRRAGMVWVDRAGALWRPEGARGIVHLPAMVWGAAKLAALLGVAGTKHHVALGVTKKFVQHVGVRRAIQIIGELNDAMLRSGSHSAAAHGLIAGSLQELERSVVALGQSGSVRAIESWLADLEKRSPQLLVAVGKAYLDTLGPVKAAKMVMKGVDRGEQVVNEAEEAASEVVATLPETVAGLSQEEWHRRIVDVFPELRGHRVLLLRSGPAADAFGASAHAGGADAGPSERPRAQRFAE